GGALEVSGIGANTTVGLEWPRVPGALSYRVYWSLTPGVSPVTADYFDTSEPAVVHRGLTNGLDYHYIVTATTNAGEGPPSAEVAVVPEGEWLLEELGAGDFDDVATGERVSRLPLEQRVHVLLLPEGYLEGELSSAFHSMESHDGSRANDVDRWADEVFSLDPYATLRQAFVIWYLPSASAAP